jgi:ParB family chromosome partitioning protein
MNEELLQVDIDLLVPGKYQPRTTFNPATMAELAESIRENGIVQPIVVRPVDGQRYEIVAGERRWRAAQAAGLRTVNVVSRKITDDVALKHALIENLQREELRPLEEAHAIARLINEFDMTHEAAAEAIGKSRTYITHSLRLLNIVEDAQRLIDGNKSLTSGHAKVVASLSAPKQIHYLQLVIKNDWTVRQFEQHVSRLERPKATPKKDPNIRNLEEQLSELLCAAVRIEHAKDGSGDLIVHYYSLEELDGIIYHIR